MLLVKLCEWILTLYKHSCNSYSTNFCPWTRDTVLTQRDPERFAANIYHCLNIEKLHVCPCHYFHAGTIAMLIPLKRDRWVFNQPLVWPLLSPPPCCCLVLCQLPSLQQRTRFNGVPEPRSVCPADVTTLNRFQLFFRMTVARLRPNFLLKRSLHVSGCYQTSFQDGKENVMKQV